MNSDVDSVKDLKIDYEKVVNNVSEAVIILQGDRIISANNPAVKLFSGGRQSPVAGTPLSQFIDMNALSQLHDRIHQVIYDKLSNNQMELSITSWEGLMTPVEVLINSIDPSDQTLVQLTLWDLSGQKAIEEKLMQSEKLSVIGKLSAGILHEIKNPLTSIKGFLQLMQKEPVINRNYIDIILGEVNQIEKIAGELLHFSKPKPQSFELQDLTVIAREAMFLFETLALKNQITLDLQSGNSEHLIFGDGTQLRQVFINLIKNAIEASEDGGKVTIVLSSCHSQERVMIHNTGKEIPESLLKKLGRSFITTKENGTGLGLMVSYTIIGNHRGMVTVKSAKGKGTSFLITFPKTQK